MATSKIVELIQTETTEGSGIVDDPYRGVIEYFEKDGTLLFKKDDFMDALRQRIIERNIGVKIEPPKD